MWLLRKPQNYMRRAHAISVRARKKRIQALTPLSFSSTIPGIVVYWGFDVVEHPGLTPVNACSIIILGGLYNFWRISFKVQHP